MPRVYKANNKNTDKKKKKKRSEIQVGDLYGILPSGCVRNPSGKSRTSYKSHFTYRTPANNNEPKHGMCESAGELAAAQEALLSPALHDIQFQPFTVQYVDHNQVKRRYTHDILIVFQNGTRRLLFVRNGHSLKKESTLIDIKAIWEASRHLAHEMGVVNTDHYTRQRRDNLNRMYHLTREANQDAVDRVIHAVRSCTTLNTVSSLITYTSIDKAQGIRAIYFLISRGFIRVDMDRVIDMNSQIWAGSELANTNVAIKEA